MDKPFTSILFSMIMGIVLTYYFKIETIFVIFLLLFALLFFARNLINSKFNTIIIIITFFLLGILMTNLNKNSRLEDYLGKRYDYIGVIDEIIDSNPEYSRYVVRLIRANDKSVEEKILFKVIGSKDLSLGDTIEFNGLLNQPLRNTNPMLFNSKLNLMTDKIHTTMTVNNYSVRLLMKNDNLYYRIKDKFSYNVEELFKENLEKKNAQLITSIILGKANYLEEETLIKYRELGLAHILAVSGMNVGIIMGFMVFIFSRLGINRKINIILSLSIVWLYSLLIGFPPSIMRASIMFTILFISQLIHEPYDSINSIMVSIVICLFINPFWLFDIGFQLSYIATLSIVILGARVTNLFYPIKNNIIVTISSILAVNIGILPVQSYYFNNFPLLGLLSNLITVPLLSLALVLGMIMILFDYTFTMFNLGAGIVLDLLLSLQYKIVDLIYLIPFNLVNLFSPNIWFIILYYVLLLIAFGIIDMKYYNLSVKKAIVYYLLILVSISALNILTDQSIELDFIDVGQGDAILIKTQSSDYLMDTGGSIFNTFDIGKNITLPYLRKQGINKLDGVIITHFDEDHSQGLDALLGEIKIKAIYSGYLPEDKVLIDKISENDISFKLLKKDDSFSLDKNTTLKILWPNDKIEGLSSNNKSLVSLLSYNNTKILFTGDIEKEVEIILKDKLKEVNIFKVPHHGSSTSSSTELLSILSPEYSIISAGRNNSYGHPNEDVLERLRSTDTSIFRTDEMGMIRVALKNEKIEFKPYLLVVEEQGLISYIWENKIYLAIIIGYFLISYILMKNLDN